MPNQGTDTSESYRILVVDDDDAVRGAIAAWLTRSGFLVDQASRGEDAVRAVAQRDYDLISMDIEMPGITGTEAIRRIRQKQGEVPIIVLSGFQYDPESLHAVGADLLLTKPISMVAFESAVRSLIK